MNLRQTFSPTLLHTNLLTGRATFTWDMCNYFHYLLCVCVCMCHGMRKTCGELVFFLYHVDSGDGLRSSGLAASALAYREVLPV